MNKDFYIIPCDNCSNNLIFHRPTSRVAKINKDIKEEELDIATLNNNFINELTIEPNKELVFGEGKISLTYMSARTCNLGCQYCFAEEGEYGSDIRKKSLCEPEVYMKALLKSLSMYKEGFKKISFFGGEPLIDFLKIKDFVPQCIELLTSLHIEIPQFSMTTNLTLLTKEMAEFFKKYNFSITVSLDGNKEINDSARKYKSGSRSVYDKVIEKIGILKEADVLYSISATINKNHIVNYKKGDAIKWIKELEELDFNNIGIIPVVTDNSQLSIRTKEEISNLVSFTREITNYYIDKVISGDVYKLSQLIVLPVIQLIKKSYLRSCSAGQSFLSDTNGNLYPCHMFCNDDKFLLGNVDTDFNVNLSNYIANCNKEEGVQCKSCISKNMCSVWCKGLNYLTNNNLEEVCDVRCVFQNAIVEECIKRTVVKDDVKQFLRNYKKYGEIQNDIKNRRGIMLFDGAIS